MASEARYVTTVIQAITEFNQRNVHDVVIFLHKKNGLAKKMFHLNAKSELECILNM